VTAEPLSPPVGRPASVIDRAPHTKALLDRCLAAEDAKRELEERIADLQGRLRSVLKSEPTTAARALSWIGRSEQAEGLLREIVKHRFDAEEKALLPPGWLARAEAQLKSVEILVRDQKSLAEKPADQTEEWQGWERRELNASRDLRVASKRSRPSTRI
jgi:hypothetical protein